MGKETDALLDLNVAVDLNGAKNAVVDGLDREGPPDTSGVATARPASPAKLERMALLDLMVELEQRLRIARLRIAIEGDDVIPEAYKTLAGLAAAVDETLA